MAGARGGKRALILAALAAGVAVVAAVWVLSEPGALPSRGGATGTPIELRGVNARVVGTGAAGVIAGLGCAGDCSRTVSVPDTFSLNLTVSLASADCSSGVRYAVQQVSASGASAFSIAGVMGEIPVATGMGPLPIDLPYCGPSGIVLGGALLLITLDAADAGPPAQTLTLTVSVNQLA